jgi:hypothetical protein
MTEERNACRIFIEKPERKENWEDLDVDGIIILRRTL